MSIKLKLMFLFFLCFKLLISIVAAVIRVLPVWLYTAQALIFFDFSPRIILYHVSWTFSNVILKIKILITVCIETELFVLLVLDSTVWCVCFDHYSPPKKWIKMGFLSLQHILEWQTQVFSRTQTLAHADVAEMRLGLPVGSLHLNTAHDDSVWCTEITASLVIHLLFLLFF